MDLHQTVEMLLKAHTCVGCSLSAVELQLPFVELKGPKCILKFQCCCTQSEGHEEMVCGIEELKCPKQKVDLKVQWRL